MRCAWQRHKDGCLHKAAQRHKDGFVAVTGRGGRWTRQQSPPTLLPHGISLVCFIQDTVGVACREKAYRSRKVTRSSRLTAAQRSPNDQAGKPSLCRCLRIQPSLCRCPQASLGRSLPNCQAPSASTSPCRQLPLVPPALPLDSPSPAYLPRPQKVRST
jgi:hypothetical protein